MIRYECADCGLTAMDLPDDVDPQFAFQWVAADLMCCEGCAAQTDGHDQ